MLSVSDEAKFPRGTEELMEEGAEVEVMLTDGADTAQKKAKDRLKDISKKFT